MNVHPVISDEFRAALLDLLAEGHKNPAPAVHEDETLQSAGQVRGLLGDVSDMWIHRKLQDPDPERRFPQPDAVIANRRYWRLGTIRAWIAAQAKHKTRRQPSRSKFLSNEAIAAGLEFLKTRLS